MARIELYRASINRKHKPRTKALLDRIINFGISDYSLLAEGCDITNTSSYIDVKLSTYSDWANKLYECNYIRINNVTTQTYFAFLDRVEPNNFNGLEEHSYRLYFTIDWWCTLLYRLGEDKFEEMLQSIDGDVNRAHVDDIEFIDSQAYATLKNTTPQPEEDVGDYVSYGVSLQRPEYKQYQYSGLQWRYILYTYNTSPLQFGDEILTYFRSGYDDDKLSIAPCGVAVVPYYNGDMCEYIIEYIDENDSVQTVGYSDIYVDALSDKRIIHSFVSSIAPVASNIFRRDDGTYYVYSSAYNNGTKLTYKDLGKVKFEQPTFGNYTYLPSFRYIDGFVAEEETMYNNPPLSYISAKNRPINKVSVTPPNSYNEYELEIVKARSEAYINCYIACDYEILPLMQSKGGLDYSAMIDYEKGGIIVNSDVRDNKTKYFNHRRLGAERTFSPIKVVDQLKVLQGLLSFGMSGGIADSQKAGKAMAKGGATAAAGVMSIVGSYMNSVIDGISLQRGVSSSQSTSISQHNYDNLPEFIISVPYNIDNIRDKLIMYGYNTLLTFQRVLTQKRKYFNYIKMENAVITYPMLCTEARLAIEEMFNNGVWLWNSIGAPANDCKDGVGRSNAMGYLWLNNYPLIRD